MDTETVGLPINYKAPPSDTENWPRMIQLAFIVLDKDMVTTQEYSAIIKPDGFTIPKEASDLHGITTERAMAEGIPLIDAMVSFCNAVNECEVIVAHNLAFDQSVIGAEMIRTGIYPVKKERKKICTMEASTAFCAIPGQYGKFKWPKLQELYKKLFDKEFDGAHNALNDVLATRECFWSLMAQGIIK
jgi:DNA polymerase III epsilon subunit-like protein